MKIIIRAGGILRSGPERDLIDDYLKRANGLTARCGVHSVSEQQIDLKKCKDRGEETRKLVHDIPAGSKTVILDERGKTLTSRQISGFVKSSAQDGCGSMVLIIGGADGFEPNAVPPGTIKWSFGNQTWPHKLVRVMAAEQMYRALSIIARTPYHRD